MANENPGGICGFVGLLILTALFTALKLFGVTAWSWWWVTAPLWIPFALGIVIGFIVVICVAVYAACTGQDFKTLINNSGLAAWKI